MIIIIIIIVLIIILISKQDFIIYQYLELCLNLLVNFSRLQVIQDMIYYPDKSHFYISPFIKIHLHKPVKLSKVTLKFFIFCCLYYTKKTSLYYIKKARFLLYGKGLVKRKAFII